MGEYRCGRCGQPAEADGQGRTYCAACDWYTNWPPTGRHAEVWEKVKTLGLTDDDMAIVRDVAARRWFETATLAGSVGNDGAVSHLPDWEVAARWLAGPETERTD